MTETSMAVGQASSIENSVLLRGTVPAPPQERTLASGAEVCTFQLVVARPAHAAGRSDVLDCTAGDPDVRRRVAACQEGDRLEVAGWLRRRFWRGAGGLISRYEVEVESVQVLARPPE